MDDRRAFPSKEHVAQKSDEVWSELTNPCGKEFELPSVTNPLSSEGSENNDKLASPFELLDPLNVTEETFLDEIIDPSYCGNLADSLPVLEMSPNGEQIGVSEGNKSHEYLSSIASLCQANPTICHFSDDDFIYRPGIVVFSNSSNETIRDPITDNTNGFNLQYLYNCLFPSGIPANTSISTNSERVTQSRGPFSYFLGSEKNGQTFSLDSFLLGLSSSYVYEDNVVPQELSHSSVAMEKKTEEDSIISDTSKGKVLISSWKERDREKMLRETEKGKRGMAGHQANKRPRRGARQQCSTTGTVFDGLSRETSSGKTVQKALWEAREALEKYPSQDM